MLKPISLMCALCMFTASYAKGDPLKPKEIQLRTKSEKKSQRKSPVVKASFAPFTGRVKGEHVRVRLQPDLEGYIIRELEKNSFVSVIDQEGDFWCITPPENLKVYIFRSFVLDNIVEGNRVNVRLEPDLDAPIIGHLNAGDHVMGVISKSNKKWLEISPPQSTRFYISKSYIDFAGGPELREEMKSRKETVATLLETSQSFSQEEMQKEDFEEINFEQAKENYGVIIQKYTDFPGHVEKATNELTKLEKDYLQRRITYLEAVAAGTYRKKEAPQQKRLRNVVKAFQSWESVEEGLFVSWTQNNSGKDQNDYYDEQKLVSVTLTGVLEAYTSNVSNKPGNFVLRGKNRIPVAYVYSTKIDLKNYDGKKVTLISSPRSNNNFAFPAYFVHSID